MGRTMTATAFTGDPLIGAVPVGDAQRKGRKASLAAEDSAARRVSAWLFGDQRLEPELELEQPGQPEQQQQDEQLASAGSEASESEAT